MKYVTIAVLVAGAAAGLWWAQRSPSKATPPDATAPVTTPAATGDAPAAPRAARGGPTPGIRRPVGAGAEEPAPGPGATAAGFDGEIRDPGWAVDQERELAGRLARLEDELAEGGAAVKIASVECRDSQCRFAVAAPTTAALSKLYGALETPEGLYGWADAVVLGGVETDPRTGELTTAITAVFERER